jgi:hypothetical protein
VSPTFALLPSPLLGSVAWEPVRDALWARRLEAFVVSLPNQPESATEVFDAFVAAIPIGDDVVLVPHSNAGLYAPAVAAAVRAAATVFVDAALPRDAGRTPLAPPDFYAFLSTLADDGGRLPPWSRWWDADDVVGLFPSDEWQRRVRDREPQLSLAYFASTVSAPEGWAERPCAYLAFGDTYADDIARARQWEWPVRAMTGQHLHVLHEPESVADEIAALAARIGVVTQRR